MKIGESDITKK